MLYASDACFSFGSTSTYLGHCDLRETDKYLQANYDFFQRDHTLITDYTRKHNIFPEVIDE